MQQITSTSLQDLLRGGAVPYSLLISPTFGSPITVTSADDVLQGSFYIDRRSSDGDVLQIGNTTVGEMGVTLINHDGRFDSVVFEGATVQVTYQLKGEQLTGGSFVIDERPKKGVLLELRALDKMARFNRPYTSGVTAGQTLAQAIQAACTACDVVMSTDPIPNGTYQLVGELEADQQYTWRQVIGWLLQLAPCNAYVGPTGRLNFGWYDNTAVPFELEDTAVWDSSVGEKNIQVTGIVYVQKDGTEKIAGTDDYALELSGNPFVEADVDACLAKIHAKINGLTFRPMSLSTLGFPHLWPMDLAHVTLGGVTFQTYFTHVRYSSRDGSTLESKSAPKEIKDYAVGAPLTQAQRIAVHNLVERYKESALSEIELGLAQLNEDMAAALGYYSTTIETVMPDSSISRKTYLHDKPTLEESMVIFMLGAPNAFAWTESGWNDGNPAWEYGLGPHGNMVMQIINAYKIGAHLIVLSDSTTAQEAFDAVVTVFRDIPEPPYKVGDLWHMPELTVDYWLNCGLTVDQVMALGFTVEERMGGHSYVCVNSRASGSFNRADWKLTGTTDKTSAKLSERITTNTNTITEMGMTVEQITETVDAQGSEIVSNTNSITAMGVEITEITETVGGHTTSITSMGEDISDLSGTVGSHSTTITSHTNQITAMGAQITSISGVVDGHGESISDLSDTVDGQGTSITAAHTAITNIQAAQMAMTEQINAIGDVYTDFPQPPYKAGDVWHMPELTVDYWLNSGLTVDQVMALGITVDDRMGGNSYVCINSRETGSFTRSDWKLTGSTDKMSVVYDARFTAQEVALTEEVDKIETELTQIRAGYVRIAQIDGTFSETIIDGGVINTESITADKLSTIAGFTFSDSTMSSGSGTSKVIISGNASYSSWAIALGADAPASAPFRVSRSGELIASNATITGSITATSGSIGGFAINDALLQSGSSTSKVVISGNASYSSYAIAIGSESISSAPFRVTRAGAFTANNATIVGKVTASSGKIGPLDISYAGLTYGSAQIFQVNSSGKLLANNVDIQGKLFGSFRTGSGGIWIDQQYPTRITDNQGNWRVFGLVGFYAADIINGPTNKYVSALALVSGSGGSPPVHTNPTQTPQ